MGKEQCLCDVVGGGRVTGDRLRMVGLLRINSRIVWNEMAMPLDRARGPDCIVQWDICKSRVLKAFWEELCNFIITLKRLLIYLNNIKLICNCRIIE
jgi:hypothetical protein